MIVGQEFVLPYGTNHGEKIGNGTHFGKPFSRRYICAIEMAIKYMHTIWAYRKVTQLIPPTSTSDGRVHR